MKEKTKVYIYTRVSTAVQVDGYSLDAQKSRMKAYAEFNDFEIVGEYEDAGKSGKSIEGRLEFNRMMEDIKSGKDGVSYVLVFKLSRFGRNAADVLSTLQVMQDFDVNLICVEDGIDSSKDAGKLMISVLSAVAEIERENIRVQTMEGRIQKAREGKWNGGFAPYGYKLEKGMLYINEEEAEAIRIIFDQYVHTDIGANGLAKYLANHGINKIQRQNGKNPLFDAALIRRILKNPVYCGKIAYGRRRTEKVHGTRNDYRLVEQENYLLVDGLHEAIVSEGLWHEAQVKLLAQAKKYEKVNNGKDNKVHLLTGLLKCPICGAGMYGNKSIKHKPDGTKYKDFFYYGCKHRTMTRGHKCEYKKQINEELLDGAVAEVIIKLVSNPKFAAMMQQKINMKIDTSAIEQEIANYEKQLRQSYATKSRLIDEIDTLDPDDKHYIKRKADLDDRLYKMYDKIEDTENLLIEARAKKMAIEAEKLTADNIYKVLIYFEKLYAVMDEQEKRQIMESLISEIHIYEERQPNGQWLKSIKFKLPIIEEDMEMSLDSDTHVETCTFLLVSEGSCTLQMGENSLLLNPGSALLLGAGDAVLSAAGAAVPELVGCRFPLSALHELRSATQRDFARLFLPGEVTVLYGPVPWVRRLRTLLEMMRAAMPEQDYPGGLYLLLILHYVEQECLAESSAAARPRNETIEQVCAYLAANYQQKFSLTEVAARFYLSPYYLSRLFRRVTGQSIVDYLNNRRIEAAQKLLETTELSISAIAEQTGFASAAHFRRVFREVMDISPLQYRKKQTK